jgi:hypothetical protein
MIHKAHRRVDARSAVSHIRKSVDLKIANITGEYFHAGHSTAASQAALCTGLVIAACWQLMLSNLKWGVDHIQMLG